MVGQAGTLAEFDSGLGRLPVLIATSRRAHLQKVLDVLERDYDICLVEDGWHAIKEMRDRAFSSAVIDADLPGLSGFDVIKKNRSDHLCDASVLLLHTAQDRSGATTSLLEGDCEGIFQIPFDDGRFLNAIWGLADLTVERNWEINLNPLQSKLLRVANNSIRKIFSQAQTADHLDVRLVEETGRMIVEGARGNEMGAILECLQDHHNYSFVHSLKVASLMTIFGVHAGMCEHDLELLAQGGLLHDVGKSKTPEHLLSKPDNLSEDEWVVMRNHPADSIDILRNTPGVDPFIVKIAANHHEKLDGTGYPNGLKGNQIDDPSLVASIVDIYSALTDKRSYKPAFTAEKSLDIMRDMCGHHIEENFFKKFEEMIRSGAAGDL